MKIDKKKLICVLLFVITTHNQAWSDEEVESYQSHDHQEESGAYLKKGLFKNIYKSISSKSLKKSQEISSLNISTQIGQFSPYNLDLKTSYFDTDYKENFGGMLFVKLEFIKRLGAYKNVDYSFISSLGYSFQQGRIKTMSNSDSVIEDTVTLQWVPITMGAQFKLNFISTPFFTPSIKIQSGASWFHQSGSLDGFEQGFWIPFYSIGPSFDFYFSNDKSDSIVKGFTIGLDYQKDISRTQSYEGMAYFLGVNFSPWL